MNSYTYTALIVLVVLVCYAIRVQRAKKVIKQLSKREPEYIEHTIRLNNIYKLSILHRLGYRNGRYAQAILINDDLWIRLNFKGVKRLPTSVKRKLVNNKVYIEFNNKNRSTLPYIGK